MFEDSEDGGVSFLLKVEVGVGEEGLFSGCHFLEVVRAGVSFGGFGVYVHEG